MPSTYAHYRFGEDIKRQLYGRRKIDNRKISGFV